MALKIQIQTVQGVTGQNPATPNVAAPLALSAELMNKAASAASRTLTDEKPTHGRSPRSGRSVLEAPVVIVSKDQEGRPEPQVPRRENRAGSFDSPGYVPDFGPHRLKRAELVSRVGRPRMHEITALIRAALAL